MLSTNYLNNGSKAGLERVRVRVRVRVCVCVCATRLKQDEDEKELVDHCDTEPEAPVSFLGRETPSRGRNKKRDKSGEIDRSR